jgi:hypothetical protein
MKISGFRVFMKLVYIFTTSLRRSNQPELFSKANRGMEVKQLYIEADHKPTSCSVVKNAWRYSSTSQNTSCKDA